MIIQRLSVSPGTVDLTIIFWLMDNTTDSLEAGFGISNLQYQYSRVEDDNDITVSSMTSMIALSGLTDAHQDGYGYEIANGAYRFDVPDAAIAAGAKRIDLQIREIGAPSIYPSIIQIDLDTHDIMKPDWYVDTTTTPWEIVYHVPGDITKEIKRAQLKTVNGNNITSTGIAIGQHIKA